ncbi:peptidoglycan editing factor PgeF [Rhodanobacter sp. A1T4]|uniref:peptidoglycan editing factor PgeF n=1 Tax=Rhodanobacter sp. A1T4 TaxID=2723087 RepID=UPI001618AB48|nr:peptidoglycan editing factor PgeF [Rhodanobacter sp. A1T4]
MSVADSFLPGTDSWIYPDWPAPASVRACVTTRHGPGVSAPPFDRLNLGLRSGDATDTVKANREGLQQALALPSSPRWLHQVHGIAVAELGPLPSDHEPQADAAVSHLPGAVLAILTADCLPVLFCAADGSEIAAAHAGWRGLASGVLEETLTQLLAPRKDLLAWIGPCIGAASYEVGGEVRATFLKRHANASQYFVSTRPGHWLCDLAGLACLFLRASGVQNICGSGFDTFTDTRFYSYRREGAASGRFASLIWLEPQHGSPVQNNMAQNNR